MSLVPMKYSKPPEHGEDCNSIAVSRTEIIAEAREWVGTRFHHQGRLKAGDRSSAGKHKGGCDCIGLIMGVARKLNLTDKNGIPLNRYDCTDYSREPDGNFLREMLSQHLTEIPLSDIKPADILLFRFVDNPQHVGIVSNYLHSAQKSSKQHNLGIIHCYVQARRVVEHLLDENWQKRIVASYSLFL